MWVCMNVKGWVSRCECVWEDGWREGGGWKGEGDDVS